jgi:trans-L-3-hydroxyproline dehydratase
MDIAKKLLRPENKPISCIEMHTCGEPTRIIIDGYPNATGTLLEQRIQARQKYDHIRRRAMLEPRGHYDMYGAVLRPNTELTQSGQAHMGVLFMTNNGYSTMCGHATIALGRFLLDTHDLNVFPRRDDIIWDRKSQIADLDIHAPCGLLRLKVPVTPDGNASDPNKPVSFVSVASFATGFHVPISIGHPWPQLERADSAQASISVDFAYGGAFYAIVDARSLGFKEHLQDIDMQELSKATESLLLSIRDQPELTSYYRHPEESELSFLYGVIVTDSVLREGKPVSNAELGVCFFADKQIDRSPTGSGVAAREALAYCKGERGPGTAWFYHSLVSNRDLGPPFMGTIEIADSDTKRIKTTQVHVRVNGQAFYSGFSTFSVEREDPLGDSGFVFTKLAMG